MVRVGFSGARIHSRSSKNNEIEATIRRTATTLQRSNRRRFSRAACKHGCRLPCCSRHSCRFHLGPEMQPTRKRLMEVRRCSEGFQNFTAVPSFGEHNFRQRVCNDATFSKNARKAARRYGRPASAVHMGSAPLLTIRWPSKSFARAARNASVTQFESCAPLRPVGPPSVMRSGSSPATRMSPPAFTTHEDEPCKHKTSIARSTAYPLAIPPRSIRKSSTKRVAANRVGKARLRAAWRRWYGNADSQIPGNGDRVEVSVEHAQGINEHRRVHRVFKN